MKNILFVSLILTACSTSIKFIGHYSPKKVVSNVKVGDYGYSIVEKFGEPTIKDEDTWYYVKINGKEGNIVSFIPENKEIAKITFKSGMVEKIEFATLPAQNNDDIKNLAKLNYSKTF